MNFVRLVGCLTVALMLTISSAGAQATPEARSADSVCSAIASATPEATPSSDPEIPIYLTALDFDLIFLDAMIPHAEGAVALATVARDNSELPEIHQITAEIIETQQLQLRSMRNWRVEWYPDIPRLTQPQLIDAMIMKLSDSPGVGGVAGLEEMDDTHRRENLVALCESGDQVDLTFIDTLIAHNSSSIVLAREARSRSTHGEIKELASSIVDTQQYQIDQLLAWRDAWFPGGPVQDHHGD
jgi:uncharacterized protein (DUF305 family)